MHADVRLNLCNFRLKLAIMQLVFQKGRLKLYHFIAAYLICNYGVILLTVVESITYSCISDWHLVCIKLSYFKTKILKSNQGSLNLNQLEIMTPDTKILVLGATGYMYVNVLYMSTTRSDNDCPQRRLRTQRANLPQRCTKIHIISLSASRIPSREAQRSRRQRPPFQRPGRH
jgi:Ulp1 family protease